MPDFHDVIPGTQIRARQASLAELQAAMTSGRLSSAALTAFYLERIDRLNPALHAVITVNLNAQAEAAASDAGRKTRAANGPRGPLDGIPVLVKDNVQVAGMPTTAGSPALLSAEPDDAFVVSRLREAGAVIIGKANLSEWANFRSTHSTSGWSTLGGQAANPYALDRNPSGSSSGSAAGVAAALAPVAVGTETDGSIVCPASACGIVGIKPTNGLVSRRGIVPISPVQDTAGPMAACVADAAALLSVLAAADPEDPVAPSDDDSAERTRVASTWDSLTEALDPAAAEGARLGIWRDPSAPAGAATGALLDAAVATLRSLGAVVVDPVTLPGIDELKEPEFTALAHEFKYGINAYLAYLADFGFAGSLPRTLGELIDFNKRNADLVLSRFGQEIFEQSEATSGDLADRYYQAARRDATRLARTAIATPLADHELEAIVTLTANPACLTDYVLGDHDVFHTSAPAAVAGCPSVTVPCGYVSGLPVGVSFFGPRWTDPRLIALAYAFEQATRVRQAPALAASIAVLARGDDPPEPPAALRAPLRCSPWYRRSPGRRARVRWPVGASLRFLAVARRCAPRPAAVLAVVPALTRAQGPGSLAGRSFAPVSRRSPPLRFAPRCGARRSTGAHPGAGPGFAGRSELRSGFSP
jgi:amidase